MAQLPYYNDVSLQKFSEELHFEFFSMLFCFPWVVKMKIAPIRGTKIIAESIGKFI